MATQRITIAKIGGLAASAVIAQFHDWACTRTTDDPTEWGSHQWPPIVRREMETFALALRANGHEPPVVYFNEHVDSWSMGNLFTRWFPANDVRQPIELHADRFELWCYHLPDDGALVDLLQRSRRRKCMRERKPQEDRWFTINLLEAAFAWDWMIDIAAMVVLREALGGSLMDSELEQSLTVVPEWIVKRPTNVK